VSGSMPYAWSSSRGCSKTVQKIKDPLKAKEFYNMGNSVPFSIPFRKLLPHSFPFC